MKYKLICFDLDGVLVKEKSSWEHIHKVLGVDMKTRVENIINYSFGKIDYHKWVEMDVELWKIKNKDLNLDTIRSIVSMIDINEEAIECINELKKMELKIAIISAGIYELAQRIAQILGIEIVYANPLPVNSHNIITAKPLARIIPFSKSRIIVHLAKRLGISLEETVYVGDSLWDLSALNTVGCSIGYRVNRLVSKYVDVVINDLREIPRILKLDCMKS